MPSLLEKSDLMYHPKICHLTIMYSSICTGKGHEGNFHRRNSAPRPRRNKVCMTERDTFDHRIDVGDERVHRFLVEDNDLHAVFHLQRLTYNLVSRTHPSHWISFSSPLENNSVMGLDRAFLVIFQEFGRRQ